MEKNRLEAFSDGVLAIIITIMVLELKVPHDDTPQALLQLWPVFLSYVLSFLYVGIYWNNHHHMMQAAHTVSGGVLWANLHLLFWLSLVPFVTGWMGENHFTALPTALYGFVLLMAAIAYWILQGRILAGESTASALRAGVWKTGMPFAVASGRSMFTGSPRQLSRTAGPSKPGSDPAGASGCG